jgi:hypothetical protein
MVGSNIPTVPFKGKRMALTAQEILYNHALSYLGEAEVEEGATSTLQYQKCERFYESARNETLASHPWNEAIERVEVASETYKDINGSYRFAKPSDSLRILEVDIGPYEWQVEGQYIVAEYAEAPSTWATGNDYIAGTYANLNDITYLCNVSNTAASSNSPDTDAVTWTSTGASKSVIRVKYVKELTDISSFSPMLYTAIAVSLAIKMATPLNNDSSRTAELVNMYEGLISKKDRRIDAMQGSPLRWFSGSRWIRSRFGGGGYAR